MSDQRSKRMAQTMKTNIALAKISIELGIMTITLEDQNGKRVLIGRTEDGSTEELIADQPQEGYGFPDV